MKPSLLVVTLCALGLGGCGRPAPAPEAGAPGNSANPTAAETPASTAPATTPANDEALSPDTAKRDDSTAAGAAAGVGTGQWRCNGKPVTAEFDQAARSVRLHYDGRTLELPEAVSASGARYADAQGNEFWEHQGEATLAVGGQPQSCTPARG